MNLTYADLARKLRTSERHFYRLLDAGDKRATAAVRLELLETYDDSLRSLQCDLTIFGDKFERCDRKLARILKRTSMVLWHAITERFHDDDEEEPDVSGVVDSRLNSDEQSRSD